MGNILCVWNFPRWWLITVYLFLNLSLIFRHVAVSVKNLLMFLYAYNNVRSTKWIFMKFELEYFTKSCWEIYFDFHKVREFWLWLHIQTQIYLWIQEHLHLCSSCVFICHISCMHVYIHAYFLWCLNVACLLKYQETTNCLELLIPRGVIVP